MQMKNWQRSPNYSNTIEGYLSSQYDSFASDTETIDENEIVGEIVITTPALRQHHENKHSHQAPQFNSPDPVEVHRSEVTFIPIGHTSEVRRNQQNVTKTPVAEPELRLINTTAVHTKDVPHSLHCEQSEEDNDRISPTCREQTIVQSPTSQNHSEHSIDGCGSSSYVTPKLTESGDSRGSMDFFERIFARYDSMNNLKKIPDKSDAVAWDRRNDRYLPQYSSVRSSQRTSAMFTVCAHDKSRCYACQKPVYALESVHVMDRAYHKVCFRCHKCHRILSVGNFNVGEGVPYCEPHYMELFKVRGRYDGLIQGSSVEKYDDLILHQMAVQSATPAETDRDRPRPLVTSTLVRLFQDLSDDNRNHGSRVRATDCDGCQNTEIGRVTQAGDNWSMKVDVPSSTVLNSSWPTYRIRVKKTDPTDNDKLNDHSRTNHNWQTIPVCDATPSNGITKKLVARFSTLRYK